MLSREVAIIKVEADVKRDTMGAKDNAITDHSTKKAAFTKIIIQLNPKRGHYEILVASFNEN